MPQVGLREEKSDDDDKREDEEEKEQNEFATMDKFMKFGQNDNTDTHFTRSRRPGSGMGGVAKAYLGEVSEPVLTPRHAYAAMEAVVKTKHPRDFIAAQKHPRWKEYLEATKLELLAHHENRSFEVISEEELPKNANIINTGMIYADKIDGMTRKEIIKARLCAKGFAQIYGIDFTETYAPTVDSQSIRGCIGFAVYHDFVMRQMDVKTAFLLPSLPQHELVYSRPPKGFGLMCQKFDFLRKYKHKMDSVVFSGG